MTDREVPAGGDDTTLGGYLRVHRRPPGFEGSDGEPYTVSLEVEQAPALGEAWEGYLVFVRWAATGLGVVGHLETPPLLRAPSKQGALDALGELSLAEVKRELDVAIRKREELRTG